MGVGIFIPLLNFVIKQLVYGRKTEVFSSEKAEMRHQRWEKSFLQRKIVGGVGMIFLSMMFW